MKCRHCQTDLTQCFVDLETSPPSNSYITPAHLDAPETWYPLKVFVCQNCWLVQTQDFAQHSDLFDADYAYFSSFSTSWLRHAEIYVAQMVERFGLNWTNLYNKMSANGVGTKYKFPNS